MGHVVKTTIALLLSAPLWGEVTIHVGPPAMGGGGTNPIGIPPTSPVSYEVVYLTPKKTEWVLGIVPGIFWGKRFRASNGSYFSSGLGAVISRNGTGPGFYAAIGVDMCGWVCFNLEYKKALGLATSSLRTIGPYAIRMGVTLDL